MLHDRALVSSMTDAQVTELSAFLSSPGSIPARRAHPTVSIPAMLFSPTTASSAMAEADQIPLEKLPASMQRDVSQDPLRQLKIEEDLRRVMRANINHHRLIGTYRGRRHAAHLPVRGQRTSTNARTAKKLNRLDRKNFSTSAAPLASHTASPQIPLSELLAPLAKIRFAAL